MELVQSSSKPVRQIARDLGVNPETLRNWVNSAKRRSVTAAEPALTVAERDELRKLRARVRELEEERQRADDDLAAGIMAIHATHQRRYGSKRVTTELR